MLSLAGKIIKTRSGKRYSLVIHQGWLTLHGNGMNVHLARGSFLSRSVVLFTASVLLREPVEFVG